VPNSTSVFSGVVHGKTIELETEPGLPDGEAVAVTIQRIERVVRSAENGDPPSIDSWTDRLVFDSTVVPGERIVKGTRLAAELLLIELRHAHTDDDLLRSHSELTADDVAALREYSRLPEAFRRSFGAWGEDAEELDKYLAWTRQQRKVPRREIEE
jgi:uncharacterized protein (DUF433 family)